MKSVRGKEARVVQDTLEKVYSELVLNSSDELPLNARDGQKILEVKKVFSKLSAVSKAHALSSPFMSHFESLLSFYPALVLPLELREDSELIRASIEDRKLPIINMLKTLKSISAGSDALFYVRGLVVSMCQSYHDLLAGVAMGVWNFNLDHAKLSAKEKEHWKNKISEELKLSIIFFHDLTGAKAFTWFRPCFIKGDCYRHCLRHAHDGLETCISHEDERVKFVRIRFG